MKPKAEKPVAIRERVPIEEIPEEALKAELARREKIRAEEKAEKERQRRAKYGNITQEMIDIFRPEHSRTTCSDDDPQNGIWSSSDTLPRCTRCGLLDMLRNGAEIPEGAALVVEFVIE